MASKTLSAPTRCAPAKSKAPRRRCAPGSSASKPFQTPLDGSKRGFQLDVSLDRLRRLLSDAYGDGYMYTMTSIVLESGRLEQSGSGPNFEGGLITLCTCKHSMRAFRDLPV